MLIKRPRGWELRESAATPESTYLNRRQLLTAAGFGAAAIAGAPYALDAIGSAFAQAPEADPTAGMYPVKQNMRYRLDRPITPEKDATTYNNFYEFGSHKGISSAAQALKLRPWTVRFEGMVEKPMTVDFDDLVKQMPLEERLYRFRCVEAWSMAVPWSGFPMKAMIDFARPLSSAKYVVMQTFMDPKIASGQRQSWYPWPYTDGLTMEEATNELSFIATGLYGKPLPKQNGAPMRFVTPWKYGFKQVKSIVRVEFTDKRPVGYWEKLQASEYGFWANVNPAVSHPRWSQATERVLGSDERVPTLLFNGYGEYVADLYKGLEKERLYA
ncbi:sulfoxide reductase catalytic subunit YedY [Stella humosa]|uniref:Protein-methionine-sulfoxide reductase catalytic subunit MsrP n=1 Tax=Stella humosa TaxID=94 RepID=A0A3N1L0E1_9PROT|nr:protein-methionine-sulfoxide reductase catalytic subunit MsrP [Stella humosa]ROP84058.1 sulfoxide reductase catalytic subunit YedY [Stella humosa]BBK33569.1 protein-methionine-sulfoxide reductase catalytic subunit MsrP [Stella humosa]